MEKKFKDLYYVTSELDFHWIFLLEAEKYARKSEKIFNNLCEKTKTVEDWKIHYHRSWEVRKPFSKKLTDEKMNSILAIILSVSALESYLNSLGKYILNKDIWQLIENDNVEKKIKLILQKMNDNNIKVDLQNIDFENLKQVISWRNKIIHFKRKESKYSKTIHHPCGIRVSDDYNIINSKNAMFSITTIKKIILSIQKSYREFSHPILIKEFSK
jgi:hypothetical protein